MPGLTSPDWPQRKSTLGLATLIDWPIQTEPAIQFTRRNWLPEPTNLTHLQKRCLNLRFWDWLAKTGFLYRRTHSWNWISQGKDSDWLYETMLESMSLIDWNKAILGHQRVWLTAKERILVPTNLTRLAETDSDSFAHRNSTSKVSWETTSSVQPLMSIAVRHRNWFGY